MFTTLGKFLFPRRQRWEQRRNAKLLTFAVLFALALGLLVLEMLCAIYNFKR